MAGGERQAEHRAPGRRGVLAHRRGVQHRRRRGGRQLLDLGHRVLADAAARRGQHRELIPALVGFRQVPSRGHRVIEAVQLCLGRRVDRGYQHRELPGDAETRMPVQVRGGEPLVRQTETVDLREAPRLRLLGVTERAGRRPAGWARGHRRAVRQGLGSRGGSSTVDPARGDVDVRGRLHDPGGAVRAHPGRGCPVELAAGAGEAGGGQVNREVRVHQVIAHHGDRRGHLHAGDLLDLAPLGHGDPAVDAGQETRLDSAGGLLQAAPCPRRPDQDVVGGLEVRVHRANGADLRGAGGGRQHGERRGRHQHPGQQRQRAAGPEPKLQPGEPAHRWHLRLPFPRPRDAGPDT